MDGGTAVETVTETVAKAAPTAAKAAQAAAQNGVAFNLTFVVFLALAMVFLVALIRALPWGAEAKAKKPLACPACLVGWTSAALGAWCVWIGIGMLATSIHIMPACGAAFLLVSLSDYWRGNLPPA